MTLGKLVAIGVLFGVGLLGYNMVSWRWEVPARFEEWMLEPEALRYQPGEGSVAEGERPYRTGKVFVMKPQQGDRMTMGSGGFRPPVVDQSYFSLSGSLQARYPQDVETLIVAQRGADVDQHRSGDWIIQTRLPGANIRVYDLKKKILVGCAFVPIDSDNSYATNLAKYIESMPERS